MLSSRTLRPQRKHTKALKGKKSMDVILGWTIQHHAVKEAVVVLVEEEEAAVEGAEIAAGVVVVGVVEVVTVVAE